MASLPSNRTKLNSAVNDQSQSITPASGKANREAMIEAYDTIDQLYNYTGSLVAGGTLQPYPFGVNRQSLINGGFSVNQRGVTGTVTLAAGKYGHDRWKAGAAGCTYTFSMVDNVTTITITAGSLVQVIEGITLYSGTYTLSWTGTAQGKVGTGSYGASGITATVVGGTNLSIELNTGTLSKVQFNAGDIPLAFQPRSFGEELTLCQRYFEKSYSYDAAPGSATRNDAVIIDSQPVSLSTGNIRLLHHVQLKITKRVTPTITLYDTDAINQTGSRMEPGNAWVDGAPIVPFFVGSNAFQILIDAGILVGFTYDSSYAFYTHWTADAEI